MGGLGQGEGQCPFVLRVESAAPTVLPWFEIDDGAQRGNREQPGGVRYLGFSLGMKKQGEPPPNNRSIAPNHEFVATNLFVREPTEAQARGLLAAWWLLSHLGGIGARSRRGFGSVALKGWAWPDREDLLAALPLPAQARSASEWRERLFKGLDTLTRWCPAGGGWPKVSPRLDGQSEIVVCEDRGWTRAQSALEAAGRSLSTGRRQLRGSPPSIDDRVSFGLPLTTGRGRVWAPHSFGGERIGSDRHASGLHLSIGAWAGGFVQCWSRLEGPAPGLDTYRVQEGGEEVKQKAKPVVTAFMDGLHGTRWTQPKVGRQVILNLDVQEDLHLEEVLRAHGLGAFGSARQISYKAMGGPPFGRVFETGAVPWEALKATVSQMVEAAEGVHELLVVGRAPLPAFAQLGYRTQPWLGSRQVLANRRKDGPWDVIDLSGPGNQPFDVVEGLGERSVDEGLVAVFVSVMGGAAPVEALQAYARGQGLALSGIVQVRSSEPVLLTADNGSGAAQRLSAEFSRIPGVFPRQRGVLVFVAGSAPLAFIVGRAINPTQFREVHFPNFAQGDYQPAIINRGPSTEAQA